MARAHARRALPPGALPRFGETPRVLLLNPPSPEQLGTPLLGQQYVAASLLAAGVEVRVIDAAARCFAHDTDWILGEIEDFAPHVVGVGLFSRWVWHAYQLVAALRGSGPLLVAGGAHTTVRPAETLRMGFDVAVVGEAEETVVRLIGALQDGGDLGAVPGLVLRDGERVIRTPPAGFVEDLDGLAWPLAAQDLYDPAWYHPRGSQAVPGGMLTSRGCPARCTFCANYVTGRGFRSRSAPDVVAELQAHHDRFGSLFFPFWDDALTADKRRLAVLCEAMERELSFPISWSAITRATMVTTPLLRSMKRAGLVMVNFGVESGDDDILRRIKKGVTTTQVVRALERSKAEDLRTACNFMLGFPEEDRAALDRTLAFMERIAPLVDTFSTLGVAVPFPGTPLYEEHHEQYGFTDWWLDPAYARYSAPPPMSEGEAFRRHYVDDAALSLDFFSYDEGMVEGIRDCLRFKAEHNLRAMGLLPDPVFRPEPQASVGSAAP